MRVQLPETQAEWEKTREAIRTTTWQLLGDLPARGKPYVEIVRRSRRAGCVVEKFRFDNGAGAVVPGYLVIPQELKAPAAAIHYYHSHGSRYHLGKELLFRRSRRTGITAVEWAAEGFVVMGIDSYAFGERQGHGPAGRRERGREEELSLSKYNLWLGRTLWGMMLRDELMALDYLCSRPEVDTEYIGAIGMSMGSTKAWWMGALDERIKACVCMCGLTRYQNLIDTGNLMAHGIYYYVPGVLKHFDTEAIVSLISPRALLTLSGSADPGSPADGVKIIQTHLRHIYGLYGSRSRFRGIVYPGVGHIFTPEMKYEALAWFKRWLRSS